MKAINRSSVPMNEIENRMDELVLHVIHGSPFILNKGEWGTPLRDLAATKQITILGEGQAITLKPKT